MVDAGSAVGDWDSQISIQVNAARGEAARPRLKGGVFIAVCLFSQSGNGPLSLSLWTGRKGGTHDGTTHAILSRVPQRRPLDPIQARAVVSPFLPPLGRGPNNWPAQAPTTLSAALCSGLSFCLLLGERWALPCADGDLPTSQGCNNADCCPL